MNSLEQTSFVLPNQFVLPDSQYGPAMLPECAIHKFISMFVPRKLLSPKRTIGRQLRCVFGAAVPETTVHEDGQTPLAKNEIRLAEH